MFDQIWIDKAALLYPATYSILDRLKGVPSDVVDDVKTLKHPKERDKARRHLIITLNKGLSFKPCQGMCEGVVCCGYHTIDLVSGCTCDCSYCILQHYLSNNPMTTFYANIEEILTFVKKHLDERPGAHLRIGTGELSDSLAFDDITQYSRMLVNFFANYPNATFELKTKTVKIENLLGLKHKGRTVVSWSLNPQSIIESEERGAAPLVERLLAAKKCVDAGYRVGFHFDPIIHYDGWENDYKGVVDMIFDRIPASFIAWISLGTLRFPPMLRTIAEKRFPGTKIFCGEFIPANGKMRYFRPIREDIYRKMRAWIKERSTRIEPYLCMETKYVNEIYTGLLKPS
jgi:spore photoproduct lyase